MRNKEESEQGLFINTRDQKVFGSHATKIRSELQKSLPAHTTSKIPKDMQQNASVVTSQNRFKELNSFTVRGSCDTRGMSRMQLLLLCIYNNMQKNNVS